MLDPLLTLIAAKTKAVGLIAGTAMVTTALVGGGAVAMTAVSDSEDLAAETAVEQVVEPSGSELDAVATAVSDTPTAGIEDPEEEAADTPKVRPPLPEDFTCDDSLNHGQNVSAYARSLEKGPGRGAKVSAVAQSDCGKKAGEEAEEPEAAEVEESDAGEVEESDAGEVEEPKTDKHEQPARAESKGKSEGKGKPAGKGGGKK